MTKTFTTLKKNLTMILLSCLCTYTYADDGSGLWLSKTSNANAQVIVTSRGSATTDIARKELAAGWQGAGTVTLQKKNQKGMNDVLNMRNNPLTNDTYARACASVASTEPYLTTLTHRQRC